MYMNTEIVVDVLKDAQADIGLPKRGGDYGLWRKQCDALVEDVSGDKINNKRNDYSDTHVVMTGMEAVTMAPLVMGPTHAKSLLARKGIKTGHVVVYRRGGSFRILKLEDKDNALEIVMAEDGLTFLALCRKTVYIFDTDSGDE